MRIAMLSWETLHSIAAGGVATHVTELAAALARAGHEVHVFTRIDEGQTEYEQIFGVHYHRCPYPGHHDLIDDANNMCRAFVDRLFAAEESFGAFDVVHAHDWLAANAMIWIKQGRGHYSVFTVHSTEYARCGNSFPDGPPHRIRDQERAGCYWADQVIAVSETTRQEIMWMYEAPDWKSTVVFNGVAAQRFQIPVNEEQVRRRYAIGPMDPVLLFCGRMEWQKGPDLLIETLPSVLAAHPRTKFLFVGDGSLRTHVERRAHEMGCGDAIRIAGKKKDEELVRLFRIADLVAVPSRNEPFGIVVLEAWSAGKPVVATHSGGPGEYVWHEVNGLKVYPNPNSIAWGIVTTFNDFGWARWMGQRGQEAVEEQFSWERVAEETLAVYAKKSGDPAPETDPEEAVEPPTDTALAQASAPDGEALALQVGAAPETETVASTATPATPPEAPDQPEAGPADAQAPQPAEPASVHATIRLNAERGQAVAERYINACEQVLKDAGCHPYRDGAAFALHGDPSKVLDAIAACHRALGRHEPVEVESRVWSHHPDRRAPGSASPTARSAGHAAPAPPTLKPVAPADRIERHPRKRPAAAQRAAAMSTPGVDQADDRSPPRPMPEPVVEPTAADLARRPSPQPAPAAPSSNEPAIVRNAESQPEPQRP